MRNILSIIRSFWAFFLPYPEHWKSQAFSVLLLLFISVQGYAQITPVLSAPTEEQITERSRSTMMRTTVPCGNDEVGYAFAKNLNGTTVSAYGVLGSSTSNIGGASQWFDAPSAITISAVWVYVTSVGASTPLTVSIHTPTDDLSPGAVLATASLTATTAAGWRSAVFSSPIVVTGPYVVSVMNPSTTVQVRLYSNYSNAGPPAIYSGRGERLSRAYYSGVWQEPSNLYAGFDADFIFEPVVNYNVSVDFTMSETETCIGRSVELTNTSSPILQSRFYNPKKFRNHFNGTPDDTFTWTLADGSTVNTVDATTSSISSGTKNIQLNASYNLWTTVTCTTSESAALEVLDDHEAPVITCVDNQTINANTTYVHTGNGWDATATDNCSVGTISYVLSGNTTGNGTSLDGVAFNLGTTTVTWIATDVAGNTDECSFTVEVNNPCPTGNTLYVNASATGSNNGTSWTNAFTDLQSALNSACPGITQIWVAVGTYNAPDGGFTMLNDVAIYGGFDPDNDKTELADRILPPNLPIPPSPTPLGSILTGNNTTRVITNIFTETNPLTGTAVLDGFTVTGGGGTGVSHGGGIYNRYASPTIRNVTVSGNTASSWGGGISNVFSSPVLTNVTVSGNTAGFGGGISNTSSSPVLTNVTVSGNEADDGGGIYNVFSSPVLTNVTVSGNTARFGTGGGIYNSSSSPVLYNSIVWGNGSSNIDNGRGGNLNPASANNLIEGQNAVGNIPDIPAGLTAAAIFEDYRSATSGAPTTAGDYRLKAGGPAINAGSNPWYTDTDKGNGDLDNDLDLGGDPRLRGGTIDLGAYESSFEDIASVGDLDDISVPYGTALGAVPLPADFSVRATLTDSSTPDVALDTDTDSWTLIDPASGSYDPNTAGTYTFEMPIFPIDPDAATWFSNGQQRKATLKITVQKGQPTLQVRWDGGLIDPAQDKVESVYGDRGKLEITHDNSDATVPPTLAFASGDVLLDLSDLDAVRAILAGENKLTIDLAETDNFEAASLEIDVSVSKKALTITAESGQKKAYGEIDPVPYTYGITGGSLVGADGFTGSLSRDAGEDAGTYAITQGNLSAGDNYDLSFVPADFEITKAYQQINFTAPEVLFRDAAAVALDVQSSSGLAVTLSLDDPLVASLSGTALTPLRLGTVQVTATQAGDDNHHAADPVVRTVRVVAVATGAEEEHVLPIRVHQAVSPNGDGVNDFLIIEGIRDYPDNRVAIFDRAGNILAEIERYDNVGRVFTGEGFRDGTYFYRVDLTVDGKRKRTQGFFEIKR